jgi:hypothetical protein
VFGGTGADKLYGLEGGDLLYSEPAGSFSGDELIYGGVTRTAFPGNTCYLPAQGTHVVYDCTTLVDAPPA